MNITDEPVKKNTFLIVKTIRTGQNIPWFTNNIYCLYEVMLCSDWSLQSMWKGNIPAEKVSLTLDCETIILQYIL